MYPWTHWLDHVRDPDNIFHVEDLGGGRVKITPVGTVMQEGTPQDQNHWNNMEAGITDAHAALAFIFNYARQNAWEIERGTVTLTNTQDFPFNDSQKTVALKVNRETTDYVVLVDATAVSGNVGEVEVTNKLTNGFKLAYTGSASKATFNYVVIGGYLK